MLLQHPPEWLLISTHGSRPYVQEATGVPPIECTTAHHCPTLHLEGLLLTKPRVFRKVFILLASLLPSSLRRPFESGTLATHTYTDIPYTFLALNGVTCHCLIPELAGFTLPYLSVVRPCPLSALPHNAFCVVTFQEYEREARPNSRA